tara:strand:- start:1091 stop:1429 length:339 start_codon:yes stop_codon:yes gene_type:complete
MSNLEKLIKSVEIRKPISFEYNKPDKTEGVRFGNVHAIFLFTSKSNVISTKLHIVQTGGVSDSLDSNPFPTFRMFNINHLSNIEILKDKDDFKTHSDYNSESEMYSNPLAKI